jgi:hypothetical protein
VSIGVDVQEVTARVPEQHVEREVNEVVEVEGDSSTLCPCLSRTLHCLPSCGFKCRAAKTMVAVGLPKKIKGWMRNVSSGSVLGQKKETVIPLTHSKKFVAHGGPKFSTI